MKPFRLILIALFAVLHSLRADPAVVFNEIMYHPATNEANLEWVELYNQMAVDMDISGWSLDSGIQYTFPEGTVINGGAYLVVAISPPALMAATGATNVMGPFIGRLSNGGEKITLKNNNGRVVDSITYGVEGDWPVAPDGSGVSLAKAEPDTASDVAANWKMSSQIGGTPGLLNFPTRAITRSSSNAFVVEGSWKYEASGNDLGTAWRSLNYDDATWLSGAALFYGGTNANQTGQIQPIPTLFNTGVNSNGVVLSPGAPDPHYTLTVAAQGGTVPFAATVEANHSAWVANSLASSWIGVISDGTVSVAAGVYNYRTRFDLTGFDPATAQITMILACDNSVDNVLLNGVALNISYPTFASFSSPFVLTNGFIAGTNTLEFVTSNAGTTASPGGFRAQISGTAKKGYKNNTALVAGSTTTYYRKNFTISGDPVLTGLNLGSIYDDGAVFYLNGAEVLRLNMPAGAVNASTYAVANITNASYAGPFPISTAALLTGTNVLAVELHQALDGTNDLLFGADLLVTSTNIPPPPPPTLAFNEVSSVTNTQFWVEILNYGLDPVTLDNNVLARFGNTTNIEYVIPFQVLPPGARLVLDKTSIGFGADPGDKVILYGSHKTNVLDAVIAKSFLRGRWPEGTGDWLRPSVATPGDTNIFTFHNEMVINEIMYSHRPLPPVAEVRFTNVLVTMTNLWRYDQNGLDLGTSWRTPFFDDSSWAYSRALFSTGFLVNLQAPRNTTLLTSTNGINIITYYFRAPFVITNLTNSGLSLTLRHIIDDGAVFYINGQEAIRYGITANPVYWTNLASLNIGVPNLLGPYTLPLTNLVAGTNWIAVEVHQVFPPPTSKDVAFGAELTLSGIVSPALPERDSPETWIELFNRGSNAVDLTNWRLDSAVNYDFPTGTVVLPGGYLVIAKDAAYLRGLYPTINILGDFSGKLAKSGDLILLRDASDNPANQVHYYDARPWPVGADGFGSSLELRDPMADNSRPEAWVESNEAANSVWQTYTYRGFAAVEPAASPTTWNEFVFGLLGEGEVLLDDFSVIESPSGPRRQVLQNGSFETGLTAWRFLGNHRHAEVITDPANAANHVLHLTTAGDTEHMHNHAETTLANGVTITNGIEYEISFKAKWLSGCNKLHTRLYFNRLAHTSVLTVPAFNGTPGFRNSRYATNVGPTFVNLQHSPVIPTITDFVAISADASDPNGVASATLYYTVNGGPWQNTGMTLTPSQAGAHLEASIPPLPDASLVQFYVEATDGLGAKATYPAAGTNSRALYEVGSGLAYNPRLHSIRILMPTSDAAFMHASTNVMSNESLGCTVIADEKRVFYDAAVHLQGSERGRDNSTRVGFTVSFPADHLYRGVLDGFTIDRSGGYSGLGGKHDELLLKHAVNKVGGLPGMYDDLVQVYAPRNQEDGTGLLILVKYDSIFLDTAFNNGNDGEMYKLELIYFPTTTASGDPQGVKLPQPDGVVGTDIKDLGNDPEAYRWVYLKNNHVARDNYAPMMNLAKTMSMTGTALRTNLPNVMDIDEWTRAVAFISLIGGNDIYTYGNSHNLIMYIRPDDSKAMAFLWDMDFSFVATINTQLFPGNGSATTYNFITTIPDNYRKFCSHLVDLSSLTGNSAYMGDWATRYASLVGQNWGGAVNYLAQRATYVRSQLPLNTPFVIQNNGGAGFSTNVNQVTLTGTAPLTVQNIIVNGVAYPLTWTTLTNWFITVPLTTVTNTLLVQGTDKSGNPLANQSSSITITNTGLVAPVPVVINEWMASNTGPGGLPDSLDNAYQDWFELYNPNLVPVNLSGFYLTDTLSTPTKFQIPQGISIAPQSFLLVWADNQTNQNALSTNGDLHANFQLSGSGEAIGLYSTNLTPQHTITFGPQTANVSQGLYPDGNTNTFYFMTNWTPRASNTLSAPPAPMFGTVTLSPEGQLSFSLPVNPNRAYRLEYKDDLNAEFWSQLSTLRATSGTMTVTDDTAGHTQRFYRVLLVP